MKKLLLVLFVICFYNTSFCQKKLLGEDYFSEKINKIKLKDFSIPSHLLGTDTAAFHQMIKSKNGISTLPQDNMPCFVPDVTKVEKMPVLKDRGFAITIPNAYNNIVH